MSLCWADRLAQIQLLDSQQLRPLFPLQLTLNERLHQALLTPHLLPTALADLLALSLKPDDFPSLTTLSSAGPFSSVQLVRACPSLYPQHAAARTSTSTTEGSVYVLKTLDKNWAYRMRRQQHPSHELQILLLRSHHTPRLIASFLSPSSLHLVLTHCEGGDLFQVLERANEGQNVPVGLEEGVVRRWMAEGVEAIGWLHESGWSHRDIKPHNFLLTATGHLLLTDFGSSSPLLLPSNSVPRRFALALIGTPDYIAPEILAHAEYLAEDEEDREEGSAREMEWLDERAYGGKEVDWWSLGIVMYELLYGQAPFFAESIAETYDRIADAENHLLFPPNASAQSTSLVRSMLSSDPASRPSVVEIQRHAFFALTTPWGHLASLEPLYVPPPFQPPAPTSHPPSPSHVSESAAGAHNFASAFFSSPSLSILRPTPKPAPSLAKAEEEAYWCDTIPCFTQLPHKDTFASLSPLPHALNGCTRKAPTPLDQFATPARPSSSAFSSARPSTTAGETGGRRTRRESTPLEQWVEMQERAWEVGMTARKAKIPTTMNGRQRERERSPFEARPGERERVEERVALVDGVESERDRELKTLEKRRVELLSDVEKVEERYKDLFKLASTARAENNG